MVVSAHSVRSYGHTINRMQEEEGEEEEPKGSAEVC